MKTDRSERTFEFDGPSRRKVNASFHGGAMSSEAGAIVLSEIERHSRFLRSFLRHETHPSIFCTRLENGSCLGYVSTEESARS